MKKLCFFGLLSCFSCTHLFSQPIVRIYGNETADSLHTVTQVEHCLQLLHVDENICVCVRLSQTMPKGVKGITFPLHTETKNKGGQALPVYQVRIDAELNDKQRIVVLAHEMVHLKQYVKGELQDTERNGILWKGTVYQYLNASDRFVSPWEQEAYKKDNQLADHIRQGADIHPFPTVAAERDVETSFKNSAYSVLKEEKYQERNQ